MTIAALATLLALAAPTTPPPQCVVVEIAAVGRSAHGSTPLPHSAAHRLIRALDRLPAWTRSSAVARGYRIAALEAASAVNIIAPRATARIELDLVGDGARILPDLRSALGAEVEATLAADACRGATGANAPRP